MKPESTPYATYPAFVVGLHGTLTLHPLVAGQRERGEFDQDVYGLLVQRSAALGLDEFGQRSNTAVHWHQHEAGGDWTQDGKVRQAAWMQAGLPDVPSRVPSWQAMTCLRDVLGKIGRFDLAGTHAVLPLGADVLDNEHFPTTHGWFALLPQEPAEILVSVRTSVGVERPDPDPFATRMEQRSLATLAVEALATPPAGAPDPTGFEGAWLLGEGDLDALHFRVRTPEWSLDMAAFTTDLVSDVARSCGVRSPLLVSAFHTAALD